MAKLPNIFGRSVLTPFTIAFAYTAIGCVWIIFSDHILSLIGGDLSVAHLTRIQTLKGILYITLTAGLIYLLLAIAARQVKSSRVELAELKERFLQLFENTGAVILIVDGAGSTIQDANAAAEQFYGWSRRELAGKTLADLTVPEADPGSPESIPQARDSAFNYARHRTASGEEREVAINATPVVSGNRKTSFLLINDVTGQRMLERQLRQAQKMEAVGRLTGGIAHDLNNVLTVIMADADLVAAELAGAAGEVREDLDDLRSAARRGASMIRKLLSFSRGANLRMSTVDLGDAVGGMVPVLRRILPDTVRLTTRNLSGGLVKADQSALEQIVENLVSNARDAMPLGGSLVLETGTGWLNPSRQHPWVRAGKYVYLRATDTGSGMDEQTQARMFEPFFTTKSQAEGGGLGMAMVYGLVKQHEGFVLVDSREGGGTTVSIYFPLAPMLDQAEGKSDAPPPASAGGGETILLVEDEDALRRAGQRILERLGYVVICAPNGQRGLEILDERGDSIDLVITDMVMPKIGGRAFYDAAVSGERKIRFLFTSGYAPTGPGIETPLPEVPFIQKPWTFEELKRKVREVLDQKPASTPPSP
jgi:two-component system cell cycle sensor histidine kinase/response regulator CckA